MKLHIIAVWLVVLGTLQGSAVAQDWSSWSTAHTNWFTLCNNKDVEYRWRTDTLSGVQQCQVQVRDSQRQANQTTVVSMRIEYQSGQDESTRDVVTIMDVKGETVGEATVHQCTSVGDVRLTDIVRR